MIESSLNFKRYKGVAALFTCSAVYASFGPLVRILSEMFGTYAQVAARMGLAFVFLLTLGLVFGKIKLLSKSQILRAVLLGIISTSIIVFFTIAIIEIKIASTIFLLYAASIFVSLVIGTAVFKEKLGLQKIIALILAFFGLYLFMSADIALGLGFGTLAAILSGASEGIGNGIRKGLTGADKTTVTIIQFLVITLCSSVLILWSHETAVHALSLKAIIALVSFSVLQLLLNYLLLYGFQNFDVNIGTVILSLELFLAAILGILLYGEALSVTELVGGVIIFLASVVSAWDFKKQPIAA
ncbi:MAG: DMT family transporter [Candidatus Moraniibacteriota bacterium]|nr:MAG: DMT family transporter [Candidatus Moranbacteria bacterium]